MKIKALILVLFTAFLAALPFAQTQAQKKVYVLKLFDEVHPASARYMSAGIKAAHDERADLILVHMNTYGGMVEYADSIRIAILNSKIPTVVFIDKNAASAGALISLACDSIFMSDGSNIGAATVVMGGTGEAAPDKYQSYMRKQMRSTAETNGRNGDIAEKMVDQNLRIPAIPELDDSGKVITFTVDEATKYGFCDQNFNSIDEIVKHYGLDGAQIITYEVSTLESIILFLINPAVSGILVMMIFGGIFFELKTPGVGFPGALAFVAGALFFAPHYLEGLANNFELVMFILGVGLIAVEIFVIPGFGVAGISGIALVVGGLALSLVRNEFFDFHYSVSGTMVLQSFAIVLVAMVTSIITVVWLAKKLVTDTRAFPFVDKATQDKEAGYTAFNSDILQYVGNTGIALTDLKPAGFIEIDGKRLDAESEGGYIEKGDEVEVLKVRSINLIVRKK